MKTGSAIKNKWEGDIRLDGRPPTYSSTDQFIEIFKLLQQNSAVNTDVGVRLFASNLALLFLVALPLLLHIFLLFRRVLD